jgi:hypothetical protein
LLSATMQLSGVTSSLVCTMAFVLAHRPWNDVDNWEWFSAYCIQLGVFSLWMCWIVLQGKVGILACVIAHSLSNLSLLGASGREPRHAWECAAASILSWAAMYAWANRAECESSGGFRIPCG